MNPQSSFFFKGDIKHSGFDLVKVAQDFDDLTLPEPSKNIIHRFTYYHASSPFPNRIFILIKYFSLNLIKYYIRLFLALMM